MAFDVPFPADYGGVIDIFYKIKALHQMGVLVHLHCFQYGRTVQNDLKKYCHKVDYYSRDLGFINVLTWKPYVVKSRANKKLLQNLLLDEHPILFEALHACAFLNHPDLKNRLKIVRCHNVEQDYYKALAKAEKNPFKKLYFFTEALKLKHFEKQLHHANFIFPISISDQQYFQKHFQSVYYLPAFHPFQKVISKKGKGNFVLYHGNLSVPENKKAALFLLNEVFKHLKIELVLAGKNPDQELIQLVSNRENIKLIANPSEEKINNLIQNAQINILPTFQPTGIKLKLLSSLFAGRFCLVNDFMVLNTGLEKLCSIKNSAKEMQVEIKKLMGLEFNETMIQERKTILESNFSNQKNIQTFLKPNNLDK